MNYWRIGSRWGTIDLRMIFKKHNIAFAGKEVQTRIKNVRKGDLVAVTHGKKIIAVGRVKEIVKLSEINEEYVKEFDDVYALKFEKLYFADELHLDFGVYDGQGKQFHEAHGKYATLISELYERVTKYFTKMQEYKEYLNLLEQKKQIILQGAPGIGKTYLATELAVRLITKDTTTDRKELMEKYKNLQNSGQIAFTTFHQSMDYEEFVEGIKISTDEKGNISYEVKDGIFKTLCKEAKKDRYKNYVLIIDEINRGNIPKIFGELITLLENDKRLGTENEVTVKLPYSNEDFGVPSNLYIIATMNTADRSIGHIDYAVRRRFAFITLKADESKIENYYTDQDLRGKATGLFRKVENIIKNNTAPDLNWEDIMVGHSYFMAKDQKELYNKMKYEVLPLLQEYINDGVLIDNDKKLIKSFDEKIKEVINPTSAQNNSQENP